MSASFSKLSAKTALWIALAAFVLPIFIMEYAIMQNTGGLFSYPLDDTYIHLAIARNIAQYHVWGISPQEFSSAASSILYPLLLAATILIFGSHTILPFIINLVAGIVFLIVLHRWLIRQQLSPLAQLIILLIVILVTPLIAIVMCGMEHTLQILFCFLFITRYAEEVARLVSTKEQKAAFSWQLYLYGLLVTTTRYEGIVLVGLACFILFFEDGMVILSFKLLLISLLPVIMFGLFAYLQGSYTMPNSVLLKSGAPPLTPQGLINFFSLNLYTKLSMAVSAFSTAATQRILLMLVLTYLLCYQAMQHAVKYRYMLLLLAFTTMCYLLLTGRTRFPRYEAYLIANGSIIIAVVLFRFGWPALSLIFKQAKWMVIFAAFLLVIPVLLRSRDAFTLVTPASVNIYQQQYQMGLFLGKYYYNAPVAFNDIGAASYFTRGKKLDLWGLGSYEVARSILEEYNSGAYLGKLAQKDSMKIAVVFERTFPRELYQHWTKIGIWQLEHNVICADDSISFFAIQPNEATILKKNLQEYEPLLPSGVMVRYYQ